MAVIETWFNQDLQNPVKVQYIDGNLFSHNGNGNRIGVKLFDNGEPYTITGTVSGYAVTNDGSTVPCTGTKSGNEASILIPAAAYQPGNVFVTIFITDGDDTTTVAALSTTVMQTRTGNQVSPGSVVSDWTDTINAAMQEVETAAENLGGIVATPYASLTFPVPLGKYTYYNENLYRCISPISTSESFTAAHWTQVVLGDDVSDLKSAITNTIGAKTVSLEFQGADDTNVVKNFDLEPSTTYIIVPSKTSWSTADASGATRVVFDFGYSIDDVATDVIRILKRDLPIAESYTITTPASEVSTFFMAIRAAVNETVSVKIYESASLIDKLIELSDTDSAFGASIATLESDVNQTICGEEVSLEFQGANDTNVVKNFSLDLDTKYIIVPSKTSWSTADASGATRVVFDFGYSDGTSATDVIRILKRDLPIAEKYTITTPSSGTLTFFIAIRAAFGESVSVKIYNVDKLLDSLNNINNSIDSLSKHPFFQYNDLCHFSLSELLSVENTYYWGEGVNGGINTPILNAEQLYSCATAMADIRAITYEDGSPIVVENRIWYSCTCHVGVGGTGCTIFEYDLGTSELKLTGHIISILPDGSCFDATGNAIIFNRNTGEWMLLTHSSAGMNPDHRNLMAKTYSDPRFGVSHAYYTMLDYEQDAKGDEDAFIYYDSNLEKWVLVYAGLYSGSYSVVLQTSDYFDHGFTFYKRNTEISATGITVSKVAGTRHLFSGNNRVGGANNYPVFTIPELEYVCDLNIDITDGGYRGWNNVIPVPDGDKTKYVFFAFDRAKTNPIHNWTYGDNYMYCSAESNPGLEFDLYNQGVRIQANIVSAYTIDQLHFKRMWSRRHSFDLTTQIGVINLNSDVYLSNSNVYPVTGTNVEQRLDGLYLTTNGDAYINAGLHKPWASYALQKNKIQGNDVRYICLFDNSNEIILKIGINSSGQIVKYENGSWTAIGTIPEYAQNVFICTGFKTVYVFAG